MNCCIKCGGEMIGDGYTSVMHCEYTEEEEYSFKAPDEGPVYCGYSDDFPEIDFDLLEY